MLTRIKTDGDINRYCGLSTDTKPTDGVPNMSEFSEIDTSKKYVFDEENGQWVEDTGSGGGSGSGKQDKITVVGLAKFDGNGGFSEAEADVDYQTPISFAGHGGEFVVVANDGTLTTRDLDAWEGGSY